LKNGWQNPRIDRFGTDGLRETYEEIVEPRMSQLSGKFKAEIHSVL
jgi:hypothetical protein